MDLTGIVAADPVAAVLVDGSAVRATGEGAHIDEQPLVVGYTTVDVVVEHPDLLHVGVRVRQVHACAVGAEGQAIGHDHAVLLQV
ncbi:hypothetical protein D3C73_1443530 [compost metagenome]